MTQEQANPAVAVTPEVPPVPQPVSPVAEQPKPVYPKMELPNDPVVEGQQLPNTPHVDCENTVWESADVANSPVPPPLDGKARILIGVPMLDVKYEFFESFLKLWTQLLTYKDLPFEICYHVAYRRPVHMAEEYLVETAKFNKCTHLLLMDDDIYDVNAIDIVKLFQADKDVIGGVMHASKFPHAMCVFRRFLTERKVIDMPVDTSMYRLYEIPCLCPKCNAPQSHWDAPHCFACGSPQNNLIQRADLIPFALTLIKLTVFDKIKYPWFHCTNKYPTDSWFADRILEAGLEEYAHMAVRLNHAGINDFTKPFYSQMGLAKAKQIGSVVNLTQEDMDKHQKLLVDKMAAAERGLKAKPDIIFQGHKISESVSNPDNFTLITHGT